MNIVNDAVAGYLDGLYHPLNDRLARLRAEGEARHVPIILRDSERLLVTLIRLKQPERILEIGAAIGYSAAVFATAGGERTRVVTVESDPLYAADAKKTFEDYDNIRLVEGDGVRVMKDMAEEEPDLKFGMVFIDAAKSHYMEFWEAALKLTEKGGVIVCDNILMKGMTADDAYDERSRFETNIKYMRQFLEHISSAPEAVTSILPVGDGMSISVVK